MLPAGRASCPRGEEPWRCCYPASPAHGVQALWRKQCPGPEVTSLSPTKKSDSESQREVINTASAMDQEESTSSGGALALGRGS